MSLTIGSGIKLHKNISIQLNHGEIVSTRYFVIINYLHRITFQVAEPDYVLENMLYPYDVYKYYQYGGKVYCRIYKNNGSYSIVQKLSEDPVYSSLNEDTIYVYNQFNDGHQACAIDVTWILYSDNFEKFVVANSTAGYFSKPNSYYQGIISEYLNNQ